MNFGCLAGHSTGRIAVMGFSDRKADEEQRKKIHNLVAECMEEGAFGLSSGLIYPPGLFSDVEELAEAASAVVPYGGYYCTHMRNENVRLIPALEEALETARRSGAPLQVSHLKCTAKADWQVSAKTAVAMIQRARRQGMDVACDQYPYRATSTTITNNFPDWGFEGGMDRFLERLRDPETRAKLCAQSDSTHIGRWHEIIVSWTQCPEDAWMCGLDMEEIGRRTCCSGQRGSRTRSTTECVKRISSTFWRSPLLWSVRTENPIPLISRASPIPEPMVRLPEC